MENYSVLTRLPRITSGDYLALDAPSRRGMIDHHAKHDVTGAKAAGVADWPAVCNAVTPLPGPWMTSQSGAQLVCRDDRLHAGAA